MYEVFLDAAWQVQLVLFCFVLFCVVLFCFVCSIAQHHFMGTINTWFCNKQIALLCVFSTSTLESYYCVFLNIDHALQISLFAIAVLTSKRICFSIQSLGST